MGGTSNAFDSATVVEPLRRCAGMMECKTESGAEFGRYRYYQFETMPNAPMVVAVPGLYAGTPVVEGSKLWRYFERFDTSGAPPREVPGVPGALATTEAVASERYKSRCRRFVNGFGGCAGASAAEVASVSYGRMLYPRYRWELAGSPPTWRVVPADHAMSDQEAAKKLKVLGPTFSYAELCYPDNPDNQHYPFWRHARPAVALCDVPVETSLTGTRCKTMVLGSRPDVILRSRGLGGRAFDVPPPPRADPIPTPVIADELLADAWVQGAPRHLYRHLAVSGRAARSMGVEDRGPASAEGWVIVPLGGNAPMSGAEAMSLFDALRRMPRAGPSNAAMLAHFVARHCVTSEAAAVAAAPVPGGTSSYRDWRDACCAAAVRDACGDLVQFIGDSRRSHGEGSLALAEDACNGASERAAVVGAGAHKLVNRWMAPSEALEMLRVMAQAAAVAVARCGATSAGDKQAALDLIGAVLDRPLAEPLRLGVEDPRLVAFVTGHDALEAATRNDPLDAHPAPRAIEAAPGHPLVAVPVKRADERARLANRAQRTALVRLQEALREGRVQPDDLLFEVRSNMVVVSDFVKRAYAEAPALREAPARAEGRVDSPSPAPLALIPTLVPAFVRTFPDISDIFVGLRSTSAVVKVTVSGAKTPSFAHVSQLGAASARAASGGCLPEGTQVLAAFWPSAEFDIGSARSVRARLEDNSGRLCTLVCDDVPPQHCGVVALSFGRGGAYGRASVFGDANTLSSLLLFLPPWLSVCV